MSKSTGARTTAVRAAGIRTAGVRTAGVRAAVAAVALTLSLAACGSSATGKPADGASDRTGGGGAATGDAANSAATADSALHDALPEKVRKAGELVVVIPGTNPPWWEKSGGTYTGAAADLVNQVGAILGVKVRYVAVPDLAGAFAAVASGRYDAGFNPYGDTGKSANTDIVDVVQEIVPFLVPKGNPKKIDGLGALCGTSVSALGPAGAGSAYAILTEQSAACEKAGDPAVRIVAVKGVPDGILAVKSRRADAFFGSGAALFHYAKTSDGALEVVATEADTGFSNLYQGMIVPKGSPLAEPVLGAFKKIFDSGDYARIMKGAGLEREMLDAPGINLKKQVS
ncbi:transporter substrate-binding domain-containing protein [Streptomyces paludis]|uniref:ABC transporter substrate-binding protein n=1 Tax=Streptomyces paludis TaxID=2282738 RepID=A0A345HI75_9ACTN|nr:transporter substrate-binding domain-containing protein [Streptomyces paludis]AXG76399.1 ABC transporter substrate-binding protein [Streptomyces paludis]